MGSRQSTNRVSGSELNHTSDLIGISSPAPRAHTTGLDSLLKEHIYPTKHLLAPPATELVRKHLLPRQARPRASVTAQNRWVLYRAPKMLPVHRVSLYLSQANDISRLHSIAFGTSRHLTEQTHHSPATSVPIGKLSLPVNT
jgi:hypothetical protein